MTDGVRLEPDRHLRDLGIRQARVCLTDRDQPIGRFVADGERVIRQHGVALAMPDLDPDDDAIESPEGALHLEPALPPAARGVAAVRVLDHQALIPSGSSLAEHGIQLVYG